ncbi:MAG: RNA polymerase subunit sigma [SAR116 cluster bacterium]|jgi:RNA polymerase sigma-70 factor (ECF subfamily)|nr:RNA polymerase subunit sigma [SAR116 cluster bacterium]RCL79391.1 MAG: RNA polymerase subunit sigma [SAR116 cluster bacterium]CAI8422721.1 MAG: ECF RNA polymerase sigma factor RpoE [SAR116 cluster bacterium]|tara:strand:- start:686 stop:1315 length:630 start_codon:yes stop_codon:yes gene_type:complete
MNLRVVAELISSLDMSMGSGSSNDNQNNLSEWDRLLLRVGSDRDRSAFKKLYEHFAPRLKSFLLRIGSDMSAAEEICQESMIMVWRRAETFNPESAGASTWIFTIARNKRIDKLRKDNRPLPDLNDPSFFQIPVDKSDDILQRVEEEKKIKNALKNLPPEQAKLILSAYYEEKSHRKIADETNLPLGTVKSRIRLAINRLRTQLEELEG